MYPIFGWGFQVIFGEKIQERRGNWHIRWDEALRGEAEATNSVFSVTPAWQKCPQKIKIGGYIWLYLPQFGATPAHPSAGFWIGRLLRFFGVFLWGG